MNLQLLCKSIETRIAKELHAAKTQEDKALILTSALYDYGASVLKGLHMLSRQAGAKSSQYKEAQTAASELLTFLVLPFISSCSTYKEGITVLEDLGATCSDETLRRRIVIYTNQIKKRWNKADPTALPINPRGAKIRPREKGPQHHAKGIMVTVLLGAALYLFTHIDQILMVFPSWDGTRQHTLAPPVEGDRGKVGLTENETGVVPPSSVAEPLVTVAAGEYFSYTDKNGVIHMGNRPASGLTPVVIMGNQVLVPVSLSYRGRSVKTMLVLDTGASVTTINERTAALLGVDATDTRSGTTTVADGRTVASRFFVADSVDVGPTSLPQLQVSILPGSGGAGNDGLLGMDYLKKVRYHVDFSRKVIELNAQ